MLEALSDYAYMADRLLYKGYGNGILAGCELTATQDAVILNEGVVFFEGELFLIKEPMSVPYYPTNTTTVVKLDISEQIQDGNFVYREIGLKMTSQSGSRPGSQKNEMEICRFKLQEGARLRYVYQDFEDRSTEFDTLDTTHAPFATKGGSSLSPDITRAFALEMLDSGALSQTDMLFCMQLLGQERAASKDLLAAYIQCREKKPLQDRSNHAVYKALARILKDVKQGRQPGENAPAGRRWKMTID